MCALLDALIGFVIKRFGLTNTLISFPVLMVVCTLLVWLQPTIWMVFAVMMIIKGMSYAKKMS